MKEIKNLISSLFWKISSVFLLILIIISAIYIYISVTTAEMYFQETRQKLDLNIASHIASDNKCFINDSVNHSVLQNVFHNVMVINPSIEVYLLDTSGVILTYYAPNQSIKIDKVPLKRVNEFISSSKPTLLLGTDPKNPNKEKVFSAAKVNEDGKFRGYIYVILGGQEYENTSQLLKSSYILRLGLRSMIIALIAAGLIGFIAIAIIIRNMKKIINVIRAFQMGNLKARINLKSKGELQEFANTFNEMADTIVSNIESIKKMDQQRRDLIANVSHDLRTPLSIIRGYIETILIKDERITAEQRREYLETTLKSTERLLTLVEELFELSKLEAKDTPTNKEPFPLAELLQDVYQKNIIIAQSKSIKFDLEISCTSSYVLADIRMMEKVFQNLIDNAIKFTPPHGEVRICLEQTDDKFISVIISDSGIGLTEDEMDYIFDKFYSGRRTHTGNPDGTGLGLTIVKKILDHHGISIEVKSKPSKGTTFILKVPAFGITIYQKD